MRQSGILMHITSLPGPYGIGTLGKQARAFIDFLRAAGQSCWQLLPLNPTGFGDSPYQSCSAYAGNHYLIDLQQLVQEGLLQQVELDSVSWGRREEQVDFGLQYQNRLNILRLAFDRFTDEESLNAFCRENSSWLSDFALYMALKDQYCGAPWYTWEASLKMRQPDALWQARQQLKKEIRFYSFVQYLFYTQWQALRSYAVQNHISLMGDVPIYVPLDSVEVWTDPELFRLDSTLTPTVVAGCPPDAFADDGQLWGNPLYRWDVMKKDGYSWWVRRLKAAGKLYDAVRLDHFRGFVDYWEIPYGESIARNGKWIEGPGLEFIRSLQKQLPQLRLIAEDLGDLSPQVLEMRDASGLPGMSVLQFAFENLAPSVYQPHAHRKNSVCYIGTHDNETARQWLENLRPEEFAYAKDYMRLSEEEGLVWGLIRTAISSVSDLCILRLQDCLDLGADARMNFPGTMDNNWTWRALPGSYDKTLAEKLRKLTALYGRLQNPIEKE